MTQEQRTVVDRQTNIMICEEGEVVTVFGLGLPKRKKEVLERLLGVWKYGLVEEAPGDTPEVQG